MLRCTSLAALLLIALTANACDSGSSRAILASGEGGVYIALGDSFAAGSGASDAETTGYVALVSDAMRAKYGDTLQVHNLAVSGATTQSLLDNQLGSAGAVLNDGSTRLVTITIGGNDLNVLGSSTICQQDPSDPECPIGETLDKIEANLETMIEGLQGSGPDAVIAIELYPNIFSGTGHMFEQSAETAFGLLNDVIEDVATRHDLILADPREPFAGNGPELTHLLDATPDAHPNDDGHRVIADSFLDALGLSD